MYRYFIFLFFLFLVFSPIFSFANSMSGANSMSSTRVEYGSGTYARVDVGYSLDAIETDEYGDLGHAVPLSLGFGRMFASVLRFELMLNHFSNLDDPDDNMGIRINTMTNAPEPFRYDRNPQASSVMANLYFDFKFSNIFHPYVGFGGGIAGFSSYRTDVEFTFSGNGMAGIVQRIGENTWLDLGYRYTYLQGVEFSRLPGSSGDLKIREARIGLRYEIW